MQLQYFRFYFVVVARRGWFVVAGGAVEDVRAGRVAAAALGIEKGTDWEANAQVLNWKSFSRPRLSADFSLFCHVWRVI